MTARWSIRRINAAQNAISAMLAGEDQAGDWSEEVTRADLEGALAALAEMEERNKKKREARKGSR